MFKFDKEACLQKICQTFSNIAKQNWKFKYKNFQNAKNIKESKDSLSRNYWNKTKYICDYTIKKYKRKICYLQKNDPWL